jgi:8-oxo-dGTP diphosphatase
MKTSGIIESTVAAGEFPPAQPLPAAIQVVAAVIERGGRILIGQRKPGGRHALKWEFPGGKVEPGEDGRSALARELQEELGIDAEIGEEIEAFTFRYGNGPETRLRFFRVNRFQGEPRNLDFAQIAWEEPARLPDYDFLEGDVEFVRRLAAARG